MRQTFIASVIKLVRVGLNIHGAIVMGKPRSGLTSKQRYFARCVAVGAKDGDGEGMDFSAAYREAYDAEKMSNNAIWTESSLLAQNPAVTQRIETLRHQKDRAEATSLLADKQRVLNTLRTFMETADSSDMARIRATELMGKACGLFKDAGVIIEAERSAEDIGEELRRMLGTILEPKTTETDDKIVLDSDLPGNPQTLN